METFPGSSSNADIEEYGYLYGEYIQALRLSEGHILNITLSGALSFGVDAINLDISDVVQGYREHEVEGTKMAGGRIEYGFSLYRDGGVPLAGHYLLLEDVRGVVFLDVGTVAVGSVEDFINDSLALDVDFRSSIGLGLELDLYGMQKAPITIRTGMAWIIDGDESGSRLFFSMNLYF